MGKDISAAQLAAELFKRHTHADIVSIENQAQIVYREADVIDLLNLLGYPYPDWKAGSDLILQAAKELNKLRS